MGFDADKKDYELNELLEFVIQIQTFPGSLAKLCNGLQEGDLVKTYREGGWNVRQIIHHLSDSHMHAFLRTKFMLTLDNPTIMAYDENAWAHLPDYGFNYEAAYMILLGVHQKWSLLLLDCLKKPETLFRTYFHPEYQKSYTLAQLIALYAWHGQHHLEQIAKALENK